MLQYFFIVMFTATLVLFIVTKLAVENLERHHYQQRADLYRYSRIQTGDIVFLGDSITDGACWEEFFPGLPVKNRGINADDTIGVLGRLDDILEPQPLAIFILIGTNDLNFWSYRPDRQIISNYHKILDRCTELSPNTKVYVQSILPRRRRFAGHIKKLNLNIKVMAAQHGFEFIDLYPHFSDGRDELKSEYTNDHLHLMAIGYEKWIEILLPYLDNLKKK